MNYLLRVLIMMSVFLLILLTTILVSMLIISFDSTDKAMGILYVFKGILSSPGYYFTSGLASIIFAFFWHEVSNAPLIKEDYDVFD